MYIMPLPRSRFHREVTIGIGARFGVTELKELGTLKSTSPIWRAGAVNEALSKRGGCFSLWAVNAGVKKPKTWEPLSARRGTRSAILRVKGSDNA